MLHDPAAHEPLVGDPWDEALVRAAIRAIVAEAEEAFDADTLWPIHPRDDYEGAAGWRTFGLWIGASGVVWALDALRRLGAGDVHRDWARVAEGLHEHYLASCHEPVPSLWMGEAGILLVAELLAPAPERANHLHEVVRRNKDNETLELMWGSPGTMLAAYAMLELTGEDRWRDAWVESAERLWDSWTRDEELGCYLWTQHLYGNVASFLGPAHGFAGNVRALAPLLEEDRRAELARRTDETLAKLAFREDGIANWAPRAGTQLAGGDGRVRVQWCHGAPGMVTSLADLLDDELLLAGGELTWTAGPLTKGPGLCHGTAGNGYAFLKVFRRTGDELWLDRARSFAMHAIAQVERERAAYGRGRFSLWTGDVGAALYLWHCLTGDADVPTIDAW